VAIVVFGENPYAEFQGDVTNLEYQPGDKTDLALLKKLKAKGIPGGRGVPQSGVRCGLNPEINASDAFVAAWLPGSEGGGVADVLVGDKTARRARFPGQALLFLAQARRPGAAQPRPAGYDPQFAYGYGLSYAKPGKVGPCRRTPGVVSAPP
jgi:beta-glucosidase